MNSLAQVLEKLDKTEEAIANYKKAIGLNKDIEEAKAKLKILEER